MSVEASGVRSSEKMSIVITTVSPETVVQVSDTRLTSFRNQLVLSETLRKTLVVRSTKAHFVVGWAVCETDKSLQHRTDNWLLKSLFKINAVNCRLRTSHLG